MVTNIKSRSSQTIIKTLITFSAILFAFFAVNAQQNISTSSPCNPVSNLSVTYTPDCKAVLTWDAPMKSKSDVILWDNTNIDITGEIISSYWSLSNTWVFTADDFEADGKWSIAKIYSKGNSNAPSELPTKFAVAIYLDQAEKPGTEIYRNTEIFVTDGANPEIILPEPFELPDAGKYWLAIAGVYDASVPPINNYRWDISLGSPPIGFNVHLYDSDPMFGLPMWVNVSNYDFGNCSMYFKIEGKQSTEKTAYNIYRDGNIIATVENVNSYTDTDFDEEAEHTWEVTVVCDDSESEVMSVTLAACGLKISTTTLPDGIIGELYNQTLTADGNAPITWTLETGNLPAGLKLSSDGTISGTPTTEEISIFTVKAQNSTSFDIQELSITVKTLGIIEISKITLHPNPANNLIYMGVENVASINVYNSMGQLMNSYEKVNVIDVSSYKAGIYFFKIATIEGNVKNFKVVVTN